MKFIALICLIILVSLTQQAASGGSKKCPGHFGGPVTNLCESHFPDASSDKVWLVKFYAPWCGHCNSMKGKYVDLGKAFKGSTEIGIGAVDCTADQNKGLCSRFGVQGFPTIKAIVNGKGKAYNGARETEPMKQFITQAAKNKGTGGNSAKCQKGLFKSGVTDAVVPMCSKHFPDQKSKNSWVVGFYQQSDSKLRATYNQLAKDLGNIAPEKLANKKKAPTTQQQLIEKMNENYSLDLKKGGKSGQPFAKVGGVCCDCDDESKQFCESKGITTFPTFKWFARSKFEDIPSESSSEEQGILKFVMKKLGYYGQQKKDDL